MLLRSLLYVKIISMDNFRNKLHDLTTIPNREGQIMRMRGLNNEFSRSIESIEMGENNYNCFMYALELQTNEHIKAILRANYPQLKFGSSYITELIDSKLLREDVEGKVVIYFNGDKPMHAARRISSKLYVSKWGLGLLWQHGLYDLPSEYGDRHKFYRRSSLEAAIKLFETTIN